MPSFGSQREQSDNILVLAEEEIRAGLLNDIRNLGLKKQELDDFLKQTEDFRNNLEEVKIEISEQIKIKDCLLNDIQNLHKESKLIKKDNDLLKKSLDTIIEEIAENKSLLKKTETSISDFQIQINSKKDVLYSIETDINTKSKELKAILIEIDKEKETLSSLLLEIRDIKEKNDKETQALNTQVQQLRLEKENLIFENTQIVSDSFVLSEELEKTKELVITNTDKAKDILQKAEDKSNLIINESNERLEKVILREAEASLKESRLMDKLEQLKSAKLELERYSNRTFPKIIF